MRDVLEEKLSSIFPKEIISRVIDDISISVSKKEDILNSALSQDSARIDSNKRLNELADNQKLENND